MPVTTDAQTNVEKNHSFFVVGIGASAGGLEAIERFFRAMPPDNGMAFVLIQHLSPDFKSLMDELLGRFTTMAIQRVELTAILKPNTIYLLPPGKQISLEGNNLYARDKLNKGNSLQPITAFFRSLAREQRERSIAVVLSGAGSDGSLGLLDIHDAGGLVLVQDESSAKFDGMPRSALATGYADHVLAPEEMPAVILAHIKHPTQRPAENAQITTEQDHVMRLFERLRQVYDVDFTLYKPNTLLRRIERRAGIGNEENTRDYIERVLKDAAELHALYRDLLIGVTRFFRDPEAFDFLRDTIIPRILDAIPPQDEIRIWTAGCATGEEAYSLAMLFLDAFALRQREANLKIFASDMHREALQTASEGVYPASSMKELPSGMRDRYFSDEGNGHYRVHANLRKCIIFSPHNLLKDPPFTRINLVVCRNMLIYLQPSAQTRTLGSLYFALKQGGYLFLGPSETTGELTNEFEVIEREWRLFQKITNNRLSQELRISTNFHDARQLRMQPPIEARLLRTYDHLLSRFLPMGALLNERREVVHLFGEAHKILRPQGGRVSYDAANMASGDLRFAISTALANTALKQEISTVRNVRATTTDGDEGLFDLLVEPIQEKSAGGPGFLLSLSRHPQPTPPALGKANPEENAVFSVDADTRERLQTLEIELQHTKESLQQTVVQLESANEELQATNEELQAANEELQSTNEELHSINEELYSVNEEHENKIEELNQVASNLHNLMQATEVGSVFTDRENQVRLFTPVATRIFNLLPQDIGRDIHHITSRIPNDNVFTAMDRVSAGGAPEEQLVITPEHQSFLRRIKPYVDIGNNTGGLIITFVDVSEVRATETLLRERTAELASREGQFRDLLDQAPEGVLMVNSEGNISQTNPQLDAIFGYEHGELLGTPAQRLFRDQATPQEPPDRMVHLSSNTGVHKSGALIDLQVRRGSLPFQGEMYSIAFVSDITKYKQAEQDLRESEARFRAIFQNAGVGNVVTDLRGSCILANRAICEMLGYREDELQTRTIYQLTHPDDQSSLQVNFSKLLSGDLSIFNAEQRYLRKDGSSVWARTNAIVLRDQEGHPLQFLAQLENISDLKASLQRQQEMERQLTAASKLESLGLLAGGVAHDFNNILAGILANAEFLRHQAGADESVDACLDDISNACLRASDICQQLLASSGKHPHEPRETDLSWLVRDTERLIRAALRKGVRLHLELAPDLPPVNIDRGQLQQVVMNLVLNASEAIQDQGGDIFVRTSRAPKNGEGKSPAAPVVVLEVEDNGVGISAENLEKIFEPFFTTKFKGRGLGLAAVKGIVNSHRGQLNVTSTPGHGTIFHLRLPALAAPVSVESNAPTTLPSAEAPRGLVLVVDDEPLVRTSLRRLLSGQGYDVTEASNGAEAIGIFADAPESFSAVLLDLTMPLMDGAKTLPHLRRIKPDAHIILTSGYNELQSISSVVEQGLATFLKKPIRTQDLLAALQRAPGHASRSS